MRLAAISHDEPAESRSFAGDYGIAYPLLSDRDGAVSRAYVGIDGADNTIPGVVIIRRDGGIAYRQIASTKDDRLTVAQLLAEVDRALGTRGETARDGYQVLERAQIGIEAGAGAIRIGGDWRATPSVGVRAVLPLGRYAFAGLSARTLSARSALDAGAIAGLRVPFLADTAALQLAAIGGGSLGDLGPVYAGGQLGLWVALSPSWALQLQGGAGLHTGEGARLPELTVTLSVARLLQWR